MKHKIYHNLSQPYSVLVVIGIAILLSLADRNFGYFFGLGVTFLILWYEKWDWSNFGIGKKLSFRTIVNSLWITILYFFVSGIVDTVAVHYFGEMDLSSLDDIRGDVVSYLIIIVIMWVFAAFGEELLFHGYYMKRFAKLLGDSNRAWVISGVLIAVYFGVSHGYQGLSGMVGITIGALFFAFLFFKYRTNLLLLVLIHGLYDSIWLTLIYLNLDDRVSMWFHDFFF